MLPEDKNLEENKGKSADDISSQNNDDENDNSDNADDHSDDADKSGDSEDNKGGDDKDKDKDKDDKQKTSEELYQEKLDGLTGDLDKTTKDRDQKAQALVEKNKKIADLKKEIKDGDTGLTEEKVKELIAAGIKEIEESTEKKASQALENSEENLIISAIKDVTDNLGEAKIVRFFYDKETNKELSMDKRVKQAKILTDDALKNDKSFQEELERANDVAVKTTGKEGSGDSAWNSEERNFANKVLKTKKGREAFERIGREKRR